MRAMICPAPAARLMPEEVTLAPCGPDQVIVQTLASGVCHTDLSFASGAAGQAAAYPTVLGHEAVGRVIHAGDDVRVCRKGDLVIASILPACGTCWHCVRDEAQHCERGPEVFGAGYVTRRDGSRARTLAGLGSFAEGMVLHQVSVVPIRSELPVNQLAMIGCGVTTGVGAVLWTAKVEPGATVAVFGCGGVGQSAIQGARLAEAGRIIAIDPVPLKREMALAFGATDVFDPGQGDAVAFVKSLTGMRGVDYAFEATGIPAVAQQAFAAVRKRGLAVIVGMPPGGADICVPGRDLFYAEKRLTGSLYGSAQVRRDLEALVRLAESGRLDLGRMVSKTIPLEAVNDAFDAMLDGSVIRSVICF